MVMAMFVGTMVIGVFGLAGIVIHHLMARKNEQVKMERLQKDVFPELETMTYKMLDKSMDLIADKVCKLNEEMLRTENERYYEQEYETVTTEDDEEDEEDMDEILPY